MQNKRKLSGQRAANLGQLLLNIFFIHLYKTNDKLSKRRHTADNIHSH